MIPTATKPEANMLQILDENGRVDERWDPQIPQADLEKLYRTMVQVRLVDERGLMLQRQGRIAFYISSRGEEATHVGSCYALEPQDWIFPQYREPGAAFLRGFPIQRYFDQLFGNADDWTKGRQMPNHYGDPSIHYVQISSPLGTQIPQAAGAAYAAKIKGDPVVALTYFGEGTTSEGDFHMGMNFAAVYKAPCIFFCRNNGYAISTPLRWQTASDGFAVKAVAYGMPGIKVDGNDILAIVVATREARERAMRGEGPTLIEAVTYRRGAHSTSDDPTGYRSREEEEMWDAKCPIRRLRLYLTAKGWWDDAREEALQNELKEQIVAAVKQAESRPMPETDTLFDDVYEALPWHLQEQREELRAFLKGDE